MNSLLSFEQGKEATVIKFSGCPNFIAKLYKLGIKEGVSIKIKKKSNVCPILIEVCGSTVAIGRGMAAKIMVEENNK